MAIHLQRASSAKSLSKNSTKYKLDCQGKIDTSHPNTDKWLHVLKKIQKVPILIGKLDITKKTVVVKFQDYSDMKKEYDITKILHEHKLPNFIKFYCFFACEEDVTRFKILETVENPVSLCTISGKMTGFIIMPYYSIGSIANYHWGIDDLNLLKNVIIQVVLALYCAYLTVGIVHLDLHLDNIVLRKTKKKEIEYKNVNISLKLTGYYSVILDFGRAKTKGSLNEFKTSLWKMLSLLRDLEKSNMVLDPLDVVSYIRKIEKVDKKSVVKLLDLIQDIKIEYIK
jgi:serine/threonine protein kinase